MVIRLEVREKMKNVAAGFSLRQHRLEACATKDFPYGGEIPDMRRTRVQPSMATKISTGNWKLETQNPKGVEDGKL
jgi:hypothetical protein